MPPDRIKNVNPPRLFRIFLASILVMSLGACAHYPHQGSLALVGTWKNSAGTIWIMRDDGTFEVDLDQDGKRDSWGKYKVDGDTVTLIRKGGFAPKSCKGKAFIALTATPAPIRCNSRSSKTSAKCASRT